MMNVLPATPLRWSLDNADATSRHLHYGLGRWYRHPLEVSVVPVDLIIGGLRTRWPHYYRHRANPRGLLQPDARWLSVAVPLSSTAEDQPGVGGILECFGRSAFPRWATATLLPERQQAEVLRCAGENPVRATPGCVQGPLPGVCLSRLAERRGSVSPHRPIRPYPLLRSPIFSNIVLGLQTTGLAVQIVTVVSLIAVAITDNQIGRAHV